MARGELEGPRSGAIGWAIGAILGALCLGAVLITVLVTRPRHDPPPAPGITPTPAPLEGLRWRHDSVVWQGSSTPRTALEAELRRRGYVPSGRARQELSLPYTGSIAELAEACGLALLEHRPGASLSGIQVGEADHWTPQDPLTTVALCGDAPISLRGAGTIYLDLWLYPGLGPSSLRETGAPAEALLGHAEAELSLRRAGFVPRSELLRYELAPGAISAHTFSIPPPVSGCLGWAVVALGATHTGATSPSVHGYQSCAGEPAVHFDLTPISGRRRSVGTAYARAYELPQGAVLAHEERPPLRIGEVRVREAPAAGRP